MFRGRTTRMCPAAALVAVAVLAVSACTSSGLTSSPPSSDGELRVLTSANSGRPGLEAVAPMFEEETGVGVSTEFAETGSAAYTSQLMTQLQSGAAPDVFAAFAGTGTTAPNVGTLARAGQLLDLSGTAMAADVSPQLRDSITIDGTVYAAVLGVQYSGIIYNTQLFDEYGLALPNTFDELVALVGQIRAVAPDSTPIAYGAGHSAIAMIVASLFAVNEPAFTGEETSFRDSPAWRGGLEQLVTLQQAGAYSASAPTDDANAVLTQLTSGRAFMTIDVTSRYSALKRLDPQLPIAMAPYPGRTAQDTRMLLYPGTMAAVNARTAQPEAALRWIEYITRPEINRAWADAAGGSELTPAQISGRDAWPPQFEPLTAVQETVMIPAVSWPSAGAGTALGDGVPAILLGLKTVDDVLAEMDAAWNA